MDKQDRTVTRRSEVEINKIKEAQERNSAAALRSVVAPDMALDDFLPWYRIFNAQCKLDMAMNHTEPAMQWWKLSDFSDQ